MKIKKDLLFTKKYVHTKCQNVTLVRGDVAMKLLSKSEGAVGRCVSCGDNFPLTEFRWVEDEKEKARC